MPETFPDTTLPFYVGLRLALTVNPLVAGLVPCQGIKPGPQWDPELDYQENLFALAYLLE